MSEWQIHEIPDLEDLQILDVREAGEGAAEGVLPGGLHLPMRNLGQVDRLGLDPERPLLVYCAGGMRSLQAVSELKEAGYPQAVSLVGGIAAWKAAGGEVHYPSELRSDQIERYSRHLLLPEVGIEGQEKLLAARVLILGTGGLGSPAALYLAAAGVGTIGLMDHDRVDLSNLQRQVIHAASRLGMPKTQSAQMAIADLNSDVQVQLHPYMFDPENAMQVLSGYDLVIDGLDNFPARYLLNDAAVRLGIPVVSASLLGFEGQVTVFDPPRGPCYRCLYPSPPPAHLAPACNTNGVLGVLPGQIGLMQATEALKLILGIGEPLVGRLLLYDALRTDFQTLKIHRDADCPICSRTPEQLGELEDFPDYVAFCQLAG